jgi:hypothetical protein
MLVLLEQLHLGQLSLLVLRFLHPNQHSAVALRLNLELLDGQDAYLRQNEVVVLNGERILEDGHTPSELDLRRQLYLQENYLRYL